MGEVSGPAGDRVGLSPDDLARRGSTRRRLIIYASVLVGMMVAALNMTVVSAALPRIAADLKGLDHYHWVFTAYIVSAAASLPIFGKLSDMYGRKRFFIAGILILISGSALAGSSQSILQLIIVRAYAGIGAGALLSNGMAITGELFPPRELAKWRPLNQAVNATASMMGPLVGGLLTDHFTWRWVFFMSIPVGVTALAVAWRVMPPFHSRVRHHSIDFLGAATMLMAVLPLLVGFSLAGRQFAWASPQAVGLFAAAAVMVAVFFTVESRAREPILPLRLFRVRDFAISNLAYLFIGLGLFGTILNLPLFIQAVVGRSATESGIFLMPMTATSFVSGVIAGQILARWGKYKPLAVYAMGMATLGLFLLSQMGADATRLEITAKVMVMGAGIGVGFPLFMIIAQNALPHHMVGVATSSSAFMRNLGGTIGVAIMGSIVARRFIFAFESNVPGDVAAAMNRAGVTLPENPQALLDPATVEQYRTALAGVGASDALPRMLDTMRVSLASSTGDAFTFAAIALGVTFLAALTLKGIPLRRTNEPEAPEAGSRSDGTAQETHGL